MAETKPKGQDNNKRLAALETSVSALAIALAANGIELKEGQDPIEQSIAVIKRWCELTLARAELAIVVAAAVGVAPEEVEDPFAAAAGALETMKARIAELEGAPPVNAGELEELRKRVGELTLENAELQTDVEELANARNTLANQLADEGKGTAPAAEPDPVVDQEEEVPEPERDAAARDVGPAFRALTEIAIGALVAEGGEFEIAFSNGEFELVELQSVKIAPTDLTRIDSSRYIVGPAINVRGGTTPAKIHGAGLLFNGEQVAYCAFEPSIIIHPGQERRFDRSLIFG